MKKYLQNKDFLPSSYINGKRRSEAKGDKRGTLILLVICIALFPYTFKGYRKYFNKDIQEAPIIVNDEGIDNKEIIKWFNIIDENIVGEFKGNSGNLTVTTYNKLQQICKNKNLNIKNITNLDEDKYTLDVYWE